MSDIKLIALDIDKTLINDSMQVPPENIEAIHYAEQCGAHVVIVSGRSGQSVRKYMNIIGINDLVPSLGGAMIAKWNHELVYDFGISCEDALTIYEITRKYNHYPHVFKYDEWYTDPLNKYWIDQEIKATGNPGIYCDLSVFLKTNSPNKILIPSLYNDISLKIASEINEKIGDHVTTFMSSPVYLEVMPVGINKGTAVENVAQYYNLSMSQVLAVGDYYNDVDMFNVAFHTACPANAPEDIKQMVEYVSQVDNNHAAVAQIIHHYL